MINPASNIVYRSDVFVWDEKYSAIAQEEFEVIAYELNLAQNYIYAKIEGVYFPIYPESSVPDDTIVIASRDAEEYDIDEEYRKPTMLVDPRVVTWD